MPKACDNLWHEDTATVTPLFISFPFFFLNPLDKMLQVLCFCSGMLKEDDL